MSSLTLINGITILNTHLTEMVKDGNEINIQPIMMEEMLKKVAGEALLKNYILCGDMNRMNFYHMPKQIEVKLLKMGIDVTKWFFKEACNELYTALITKGFTKSIHSKASSLGKKYLPTHWSLGNIDTISFTDELDIDGKNYGTHIPYKKGGVNGPSSEDFIISDHLGVYATIKITKKKA
jgi:endonuclease/exonuclease/phosphatase family metal-dependent hydrolase